MLRRCIKVRAQGHSCAGKASNGLRWESPSSSDALYCLFILQFCLVKRSWWMLSNMPLVCYLFKVMPIQCPILRWSDWESTVDNLESVWKHCLAEVQSIFSMKSLCHEVNRCCSFSKCYANLLFWLLLIVGFCSVNVEKRSMLRIQGKRSVRR